jgi:hypothetical protein
MSLTYQLQVLLAMSNGATYSNALIEIRMRLLFWMDELADAIQDIDDELNDEY